MRFTIKTIGCKVNTYESNKIKAELQKAGLIFIDVSKKNEYKDLDFYIINTCSVTSIADKKSRQMIHAAKKINEKMKIIATGCYNPLNENKNANMTNEVVDLYIPNSEKQNFKKIFLEKFCIDDKSLEIDNIKKNQFEKKIVSKNSCKSDSRIREFIKIQDGCNQYCTYCIIPYLRGNIKSREDDDIIDEIKEKLAGGTKEIVLTGIHLSSFGLDRMGKTYESDGAIDIARKSLLNIMTKIADLSIEKGSKKIEVERIRLGSLEPRIISDDFIKQLNAGKLKNKFCANFCLSLQSGCDKILKSMNRHYTVKDYECACTIIRKYLKTATITTDVIVGFPGETDEDFEQSLSFVMKMRFLNPNIFPYSRRKGTKADGYENQIEKNVKHARAIKMITECEKITKEIENEHILENEPILVEEVIEQDGERFMIGYTKEYIKRKIKI